MDYHAIYQLNQCLPRPPRPPALTADAGIQAPKAQLSRNRGNIEFIQAYSDPTFGWKAAARLWETNTERFPMFPSGNMQWVYKAWLLLSDEERYAGHPHYEAIHEAYALFTRGDKQVSRGIVEAALITGEGDVDSIARLIGMNPLELAAYEALFFNVLDRKQDAMFLREIVYPATRLEETTENYFNLANLNKLLLRLGYNKGLADVLYFAGYKTNLAEGITTAQAQEDFQKASLIQGYVLSRAGFLNYDKQHVSISSARALVQASKLGGEIINGDAATGIFAEIVGAQLEADAESMRNAINKSLLS